MASSINMIRQFSTSAVRAKLIQPPIAVFGIDGRYATALYSAAAKEKKLDSVEKELRSIQASLKSDIKFRDFLANPAVQKTFKKDALMGGLKKLGASNITQNLLGTMTENGRLKRLGGVINQYLKLMSAYRGEVLCEITSAKPLDEAALKEIKAALQGFVKKGEVLQVETKVDPSIIGGLIVSVGDKFVDMSIGSKIKLYTGVISQAV